MSQEPIHVLSLGAGVQSSTLALMAAKGEVGPMPTAAIFADTQDEPASVYKWLDWLETKLPFPVYRVTAGKLSDNLVKYDFTQIPAFHQGSIGKRQCTSHYKIAPIRKKMREMLGIVGQKTDGVFVSVWIGISTDEVVRRKDSREHWAVHRFPLLDANMSRRDCENWLKLKGFPTPPKSACVYCPYRGPAQWRESKKAGGDEWQTILRVSRVLEKRGEYLTKHCLPIDQVDFSTDIERGQGLLAGFGNECEGMCGV